MATIRTDGYITDKPFGNWSYSNVGKGVRGDAISPSSPAYARVERSPAGAIAGTKVDGNGNISAGPIVDFKSADSVLSSAPADNNADRPYIVYAGVSPMSLQQAIIVWNTDVVILNKSKITGGKVASLAGRLMIINLDAPVAIDGEEQERISIGAGAVGFYKDVGAPDQCDPPDGNLPAGGGGNLPDLPELPNFFCHNAIKGTAGVAGGGGGQPVADGQVFCDMCNVDAQCGEFEGDRSVFVVNNALICPVRCCYPFVLLQLSICDPEGTPAGDCPVCTDCPVWLASMELYASTLPLEVFALDQLQTIDPDYVNGSVTNYSNGYPAVLLSDVDCDTGSCSSDIQVQIIGVAGPTVFVSGKWAGKYPGHEGQACTYYPECNIHCGSPCEALIYPDEVDCFVAEDIIKPSERSVPVSFFDSFMLRTSEVTIPSSVFTEDVNFLTDITTANINSLTDLKTAEIEF